MIRSFYKYVGFCNIFNSYLLQKGNIINYQRIFSFGNIHLSTDFNRQ